MKTTILQEDLNKGLGIVSRVVASRGQLPVLTNVLIEATKSGISLAATNLEIGLRVEVGGKVDEEGAITIPAKDLNEFVSSLSGNIKMTSDGDKLKIEDLESRGNFAGISASEFPPLPKTEEMGKKKAGVQIAKKIVLEVAKQVAYAAAGDESRPVLTGVRFQVIGDSLTVVATDGFRLARKVISDKLSVFSDDLILPARTILELARVVEEQKDEEVEMTTIKQNNQVIFKYGNVEVISRVLEGNFPDTEKIIPRDFKTQVTVDRLGWIKTLRTAGIFARDNSNIVKFTISGSKFVVGAAASGVGEGESVMEVEKKGEDGEIAFNYKFVMDFLNSIDGERVVFKMNDNLSPGVWVNEKDGDLVALVMPVRV